MKVVVVVTTHRRRELLLRTLSSMQKAEWPASVEKLVVLENDSTPTSDISGGFPDLPLQYRFFPHANKSAALNELLPELAGTTVIFLDDDVLIPACLLRRYCKAFEQALRCNTVGRGQVAFWGGAVTPDFEQTPPGWLTKYLPRSVMGWNIGDVASVVNRPNFLGCSWAATADALLATNGFDETRGPGSSTISIGQEASSQQRMLDAGYAGVYIPGPSVQHYVPQDRCSPEWALQRVHKNGRGFGIRYATRFGRWIRHPAGLRLLWAKMRCRENSNPHLENEFHRLYELHRWQGFVEGISPKES